MDPKLLSKLSTTALDIEVELQALNSLAKKAHLDVKDRAWTEYLAWIQSQEGQQWFQQKLESCYHRCPECGADFRKEKPTVDHKHPRSHCPWLAWDRSNLWLLCSSCNTTKSDKTWNAYIEAVKLYRGQAAVNRILQQAPSAEID